MTNKMTNQPDLFGQEFDKPDFLIKLKDGQLEYHEAFFKKGESDRLLAILLKTIQWKQDIIKMYGKDLPLPRLSAWYGDDTKPYTYSGITLNQRFRCFHCVISYFVLFKFYDVTGRE